MRLDESDDHVRPALEAPPPLVEHGARLAHAGRRAEVDPELAGRAYALVLTRARGHLHLASPGPARASVHSHRRSEGRKVVTHVRPSGLVHQGNVPADRAGNRRHAGRAGRAAGPAAPLPSPPQHGHPGVGVRTARTGGCRHRRLPSRRRGRAGRVPRLRPLLPPSLQHADRPLAPELDRARRLCRGRARRLPGRGQAAERPGGGGAPDRGVRTAVRVVAGADRRSHAVAAADAHGRHRAIRLRAALDGARAARERERRPWVPERRCGWRPARGNR